MNKIESIGIYVKDTLVTFLNTAKEKTKIWIGYAVKEFPQHLPDAEETKGVLFLTVNALFLAIVTRLVSEFEKRRYPVEKQRSYQRLILRETIVGASLLVFNLALTKVTQIALSRFILTAIITTSIFLDLLSQPKKEKRKEKIERRPSENDSLEANAKVLEANARAQTAESQKANLEARIARLESDIARISKIKENVEGQFATLSQQNSDVLSMVNKKESEKRELERQLEAKKKETEEKTKKLETEILAKIQEINQVRHAFVKFKTDTEKEKDDYKTQIADLNIQKFQIESEKAIAEKALLAAKKTHQEIMEKLQAQLQLLVNEKEQLKQTQIDNEKRLTDEIHELNRQITALRDEKSQVQQMVQTLETQLKEAKEQSGKEIAALQLQILDLEKKVRILNGEKDSILREKETAERGFQQLSKTFMETFVKEKEEKLREPAAMPAPATPDPRSRSLYVATPFQRAAGGGDAPHTPRGRVLNTEQRQPRSPSEPPSTAARHASQRPVVKLPFSAKKGAPAEAPQTMQNDGKNPGGEGTPPNESESDNV